MRAAVLIIITALCVWLLTPFLPSPQEFFNERLLEVTPLPTPPSTTPPPKETPPPIPTPPPKPLDYRLTERNTWQLINLERELDGSPPTRWNDELYSLSKGHTLKMAERGEIFHSPETASYVENCWGGKGYYQYSEDELAEEIVNSWMNSPLHRAWLLHKPLKTAVVSIVVTPDGQFASWTFWKDEMGMGPELVARIAEEWERETNKNIPWIEWLYMKGYLD